jgi:hypothetical protein
MLMLCDRSLAMAMAMVTAMIMAMATMAYPID